MLAPAQSKRKPAAHLDEEDVTELGGVNEEERKLEEPVEEVGDHGLGRDWTTGEKRRIISSAEALGGARSLRD